MSGNPLTCKHDFISSKNLENLDGPNSTAIDAMDVPLSILNISYDLINIQKII